MSKLALLSNVNMEPVSRLLKRRGIDVWIPNGYGDIFGVLTNPASGYRSFSPDVTLLYVDIDALLAASDDFASCEETITEWFTTLKGVGIAGDVLISDAICRRNPFFSDRKDSSGRAVELLWYKNLKDYLDQNDSAYIFEAANIAASLGKERFFTDKFWYLARIPYTHAAHERISDNIASMVDGLLQPRKKALLVDLDNTLWGGVVGEVGPLGIALSDEHTGLIYKDVQRQLLKIKKTEASVVCVTRG